MPSSRLFLSIWLLRIGLAFVFLFAAISGLLYPDMFIKWIPKTILPFLDLDINIALVIFFVWEMILVLCILSGTYADIAAFVMALMLAGITFGNFDSFNILFRNVGLIFAAFALSVLELIEKEEKKQKTIL